MELEIDKRIAEKAKEIYKERYGKRSPDSLSSQEVERVNHDAAVQVQREVREQQRK